MTDGKDRARRKHPWRENLEAMTMAVAVALLFKAFVLEVSKIPSGSMQPTLLGSPSTGVFDRVLVDKLSFAFRDPRRWEIVVFRHPLERSRVMVKRVVGLPGEELDVRGGDLWARASSEEPWRILRRPDAVMDEAWLPLDPDEPVGTSWAVTSGEGWSASGRAIRARGSGVARFRPDVPSVTDVYVDGYPDPLRAPILSEVRRRGVPHGRHEVGDLRLDAEVTALEDAEHVAVELREGTRTYEVLVPGPGAPADAAPEVRVRDAAVVAADDGRSVRAPERVERGEPYRLPAGEAVRLSAWNLDDRVALELDGERWIEVDVAPAEDQRSSVQLAVRGAGADLEDLQVSRDVHYLRQDLAGPVRIPDGHYFVLGDNALDSADSRDWESVTLAWTDEAGAERRVQGNLRERGENPTPVQTGEGEDLYAFRNVWGDRVWAPRRRTAQVDRRPHPFVPRQLVQGRALAVFWPIRPDRGLVRLGWLR